MAASLLLLDRPPPLPLHRSSHPACCHAQAGVLAMNHPHPVGDAKSTGLGSHSCRRKSGDVTLGPTAESIHWAAIDGCPPSIASPALECCHHPVPGSRMAVRRNGKLDTMAALRMTYFQAVGGGAAAGPDRSRHDRHATLSARTRLHLARAGPDSDRLTYKPRSGLHAQSASTPFLSVQTLPCRVRAGAGGARVGINRLPHSIGALHAWRCMME